MRLRKLKEDKISELISYISEKYSVDEKDLNVISKDIEGVISAKMKAEEKAEIHFSPEAYYKMLALIQECSDEIAWEGIVQRSTEKNNVFYISEIVVPPQIVTGATVDTDEEKYIDYLFEDEGFAEKRRFHGHSHVNMGVAPSGTDITYRDECTRNIDNFYIFAIFNKKNEFHFEVFDIENNRVYENKDVDFYIPEPDYSEWAKGEIKRQLTRKYSGYNGYGSYGSAYTNGSYWDTKTKTWVKKEDEKESKTNITEVKKNEDDKGNSDSSCGIPKNVIDYIDEQPDIYEY